MNKKFQPVVLLAILGIVLLLAACTQAATPTSGDSIQDIVWQWESATNKTTGEVTTVTNPENYSITFNTDGTLVGKADCNNFNGTYSQESGFSIKIGASTMLTVVMHPWINNI